MDSSLPKGSYTFLKYQQEFNTGEEIKDAVHYALFIKDSKLSKESKEGERDFYRTGKYTEKTSFQNK